MQAAFARPRYVSQISQSCSFYVRTSRVCAAPENYSPLLVGGIAEHFVELHSEAVQVTDVERTKVSVEGIVK